MNTADYGEFPQPDELRRYMAKGRRLQGNAMRAAFARAGRGLGRGAHNLLAPVFDAGKRARDI